MVWSGGGAFVVHLRWRQLGAPSDTTTFQTLWAPGTTIREIAGYRTLGEATRAAKRFAHRSAA